MKALLVAEALSEPWYLGSRVERRDVLEMALL